MDMKTAILNGDAHAVRRILAEDSSRANALIRWGVNDCISTHPLHYVSACYSRANFKKAGSFRSLTR